MNRTVLISSGAVESNESGALLAVSLGRAFASAGRDVTVIARAPDLARPVTVYEGTMLRHGLSVRAGAGESAFGAAAVRIIAETAPHAVVTIDAPETMLLLASARSFGLLDAVLVGGAFGPTEGTLSGDASFRCDDAWWLPDVRLDGWRGPLASGAVVVPAGQTGADESFALAGMRASGLLEAGWGAVIREARGRWSVVSGTEARPETPSVVLVTETGWSVAGMLALHAGRACVLPSGSALLAVAPDAPVYEPGDAASLGAALERVVAMPGAGSATVELETAESVVTRLDGVVREAVVRVGGTRALDGWCRMEAGLSGGRHG